MAKSPPSSAGSKSAADKSSQSLPPAAVAKRVKGGPGGNGNRPAGQGQLELVPEELPEEMEAAEALPAPAPASATVPPAGGAQPAAVPAVAPPAMRELGLTSKDMWKVDLKGKRIALDEKTWREELARALGRAPVKGQP